MIDPDSPAGVLAAAVRALGDEGDYDDEHRPVFLAVQRALDELAWQLEQLPVREKVQMEHEETVAEFRREAESAHAEVTRLEKTREELESQVADLEETVSDLAEKLEEKNAAGRSAILALQRGELGSASVDPADPAWDRYFALDEVLWRLDGAPSRSKPVLPSAKKARSKPKARRAS